jgi:(1->4)-alpha-D-glucan 1-alpha-D-glucosylmutase
MPQDWRSAVAAWSGMLAGYRGEADAVAAPEPEMEWHFYQALAGVWPADLSPGDGPRVADLAERMGAYMLKVVREAKSRTSWTAPAAGYEEAVGTFVRGAFGDGNFLDYFARATARLRLAGAVTSLSQLAIKLAAPGVPDIYQGTEYWDLALVDPDNRRPVDFAARRSVIEDVDAASADELLRDWRSGLVKLRLMKAGLRFRRDHPDLFEQGEYLPLDVTGEAARHLVAFARRHEADWLVLIATRFPISMLDGTDIPLVAPDRWGDTIIGLPAAIEAMRLRDIAFGGEMEAEAAIPAADALARFPVALLHGTA